MAAEPGTARRGGGGACSDAQAGGRPLPAVLRAPAPAELQAAASTTTTNAAVLALGASELTVSSL